MEAQNNVQDGLRIINRATTTTKFARGAYKSANLPEIATEIELDGPASYTVMLAHK
jgi:hypothetical protein